MPQSDSNVASGNPTGVNIFQMDRNQLQNLHRTLWARQNPNDQLSARTLRIRATEWLLLNGLSTMHRFENSNGAQMDMDGRKMKVNLEDECNTCRQYRVGKCWLMEIKILFIFLDPKTFSIFL
jgi:hypothetical protein